MKIDFQPIAQLIPHTYLVPEEVYYFKELSSIPSVAEHAKTCLGTKGRFYKPTIIYPAGSIVCCFCTKNISIISRES